MFAYQVSETSYYETNAGQRVGRNPQTGEAIQIAPRRVMSFKISQVLKEAINTGSGELPSQQSDNDRDPDERI